MLVVDGLPVWVCEFDMDCVGVIVTDPETLCVIVLLGDLVDVDVVL